MARLGVCCVSQVCNPGPRAATQMCRPSHRATALPRDLGPSIRAVPSAIAGVANPGGRRRLERSWASLSSGTPANAAGRLDEFTRTVRSTTQLSDGEEAASCGALARLRARL